MVSLLVHSLLRTFLLQAHFLGRYASHRLNSVALVRKRTIPPLPYSQKLICNYTIYLVRSQYSLLLIILSYFSFQIHNLLDISWNGFASRMCLSSWNIVWFCEKPTNFLYFLAAVYPYYSSPNIVTSLETSLIIVNWNTDVFKPFYQAKVLRLIRALLFSVFA
jgi:hypothetical protein